MHKAIAKALTWRLIGTTEILAISFWTTGHIATAGHTAGIAAISSLVMYVAHELAWETGIRESPYSSAARRLWSRPKPVLEQNAIDGPSNDPTVQHWYGRIACLLMADRPKS